MELSYNELKKRDVINVPDGRCLGRITDIRLKFPEGILVGILVPGRKTRGIFRCFDKTEFYIDRSRIIKIGGDVILVDISCNHKEKPTIDRCKPKQPKPECCPPPRRNNACDSEQAGYSASFNAEEYGDFEIFSQANVGVDMSDY